MSLGREVKDDSGVSPVIGMILVLAISVVGIAAILYWGLPAIDEMKANVEYRSIQTQFGELDSTIKELVAGTTEKTAKRWQPVQNRGSIAVISDSEPWLYAIETYNASYNSLAWTGFVDGDHEFTIWNRGSNLQHLTVSAYIIAGSASPTKLNVSVPGMGTAGAQMTEKSLANGSSMSFRLFANGTTPADASPINLDSALYKFQVYNGKTLIAEAWFAKTGRIDYRLSAVTDRGVAYNNGAIISTASGSAIMSNSPPIPPSLNTTGVPRFFGRLVALNGTAGFAGQDRFDLLISLYSTATLASYDCSKADGSDCIYAVKLFVWGSQKPVWDSYLVRPGLGYQMKLIADPDAGNYLEERQWLMGYTLLSSNVKLVG